jgi:hypothetical protein
MKLPTLLLAVLLCAGAGLALADDPKPKAKPDAAASAAASGSASASANASAPKAGGPTRAEIKAEAIEATKKHRTTLSESEDLLKK